MKVIGKKQHPILGEIDDIVIELTDFDFSIAWDELSIYKKADFCAFLKILFLNKNNEHLVKDWWEYYSNKYN